MHSIFVLDGTLYKQIDGLAVGSPLGPTLANIFLCHYEKIWLDMTIVLKNLNQFIIHGMWMTSLRFLVHRYM